jgi:hypothetical protein
MRVPTIWTKKFGGSRKTLSTPLDASQSSPVRERYYSPAEGGSPLQTPPAPPPLASQSSTAPRPNSKTTLVTPKASEVMKPFMMNGGKSKRTNACKIEVFVRIRPFLPELGEKPSENQLPLWRVRDSTISAEDGSSSYSFDGILFPHCDNTQTYEACGLEEAMYDVLRGVNFTLFAYGHTGSGKTHTILGSAANAGDSGITQKALESVFRQMSALPTEFKKLVKISFFEIYNEEIFDLLAPIGSNNNMNATTGKQGGGLSLRSERAGNGFAVVGLTEKTIHSASAGIQCLEDAISKRQLGSSHVHDRSSRSHCVFRISTTVTFPSEGLVVTAKGEANLVDLAGSEAISDAAGRKETTCINLSLTHLKKVITELSKKEKFVSYRNSMLTKVLKQGLGGNSRTVVICNTTLSDQFLRETKLTLQFGALAKAVTTAVEVNEQKMMNAGLLQEENEMLRRKLQELEAQLQSAGTSEHVGKRGEHREVLASASAAPTGREHATPPPEMEVKLIGVEAKREAALTSPVPQPNLPPPPPQPHPSTTSPQRGSPKSPALSSSPNRRMSAKAIAKREEQQLVELVAQTLTYLGYGTPVLLHYAPGGASAAAATNNGSGSDRPPIQGTLQLDVRNHCLIFTPPPSPGGGAAHPQVYSLRKVAAVTLRSLAPKYPPWIALSSLFEQGGVPPGTTPPATPSSRPPPRRVPGATSAQKSDPNLPPSFDVLHFACRNFEDHECWMLCISRLLQVIPEWVPLEATGTNSGGANEEDYAAEGDDAAHHLSGEESYLLSKRLQPEEYSFCLKNHIDCEKYLEARDWISDALGLPVVGIDETGTAATAIATPSRTSVGTGVGASSPSGHPLTVITPLTVRASTRLYLHEAQLVCAFLSQQGLLSH